MSTPRRSVYVLVTAMVLVAGAALGVLAWLDRSRASALLHSPGYLGPTPTPLLPPQPGEMRDEPAPPLRTTRPVWPTPAPPPPAVDLNVPPPPLSLPRPHTTQKAGPVEFPRAPIGQNASLGDDGDANFANDLLGLRREGLEVALVAARDADGPAARTQIAEAVGAIHALFPRARLGAVVYGAGDLRQVPLAADPAQVCDALASPPAAERLAGRTTGLGAALIAATRLAWGSRCRRFIVLITSRPPWIAEIPPALDAARAFAGPPRSHVCLLTFPSLHAVGDPMDFDRLASGDPIARRALHGPEDLASELLTVVLGDGARPRSGSILHALRK